MADYRSTLTGTQMDAALLDMAEHNSEAYAVGERNGIAVASDDVTYHNNARYYAQIASSQIVGDASSAVRWDTDQSEALTDAQKAQARENINAASDSDVVKITAQTLTSAEQAQARANIAAGGSNRNLLDNGWFTVNQRQITTPSSPISGYPADRWYGTYSAVTSDGVTLPAQNAVDLYQKLEPDLCAALVGKTVTVSTLEQDGTISTYTLVFPAYGSGEGGNYNMGNGIGCFVQNISGYQRVRFRISDQRTTPFALRAAKLELGSVSTLANDAPPDYGTELAKCQRYFLRIYGDPIGTGYISSGLGTAFILIPTGVTMRAKPTVSYSGAFSVRVQGSTIGVSAMTFATPAHTGGGVGIVCTLASNAGSVGACAMYPNATTGYIDLSADL